MAALVEEPLDGYLTDIPGSQGQMPQLYGFVANNPVGLTDRDGRTIVSPDTPDWEKWLEELKKKVGEKIWSRALSFLGKKSMADAMKACDTIKCSKPRDERWVLLCQDCVIWQCAAKVTDPKEILGFNKCVEIGYGKCDGFTAPWELGPEPPPAKPTTPPAK